MSDKPYSVKTLAERWGCSVDTIYDLISRGDLPSFRAGGRLLRIAAGAVAEWESAGGNTRSDGTGSGNSMTKRSSSGRTRRGRNTAEDWASLNLK